MILYLDTSALVKLYADEEHSKTVRQVVGKAKLVMCHVITYVEVRAALAKKHRVGNIDADTHSELKKELRQDWPSFERITLDESIVHRAADLAEIHALRGFDSIHLACAEVVAANVGTGLSFLFACFDEALNKAAAKLGLPLLSLG